MERSTTASVFSGAGISQTAISLLYSLKQMNPITVYTTDRCGLCVGAKKLLEQRGIAYREVNLSRDPDGRNKLQRLTGMFTFPQIVIGEHPVGGFNELLAAEREGRLDELMRGAAA